MPTFQVSNTSGLIQALKKAKDGDVVSLASGNYAGVDLRGIKVDGNVTIQSADLANQAVITDMTVRDSKGLTFRNMEMSAETQRGIYAFQLFGSSDIHFDKLSVHGSSKGFATNDESLLVIRDSQDVTVTASRFSEGWHGITFIDSERVELVGNSFENMRTDGIRGGGTSNLTIANNYFTDFHPIGMDHPDAIQIWSTNATEGATDISITGNVVNRGEGAPIQGIFIRDTFLTMPFERVTIQDNTVVGAAYNGIAIGNVRGLDIQNNNVVGFEDQKSWIRVHLASDAVVSNNRATDVEIYDSPGLRRANNVKLASFDGTDATAFDGWLDGFRGRIADLAASVRDGLDPRLEAFGLFEGGSALSATQWTEQLVSGTNGADRLVAGAIGDFRLEGGAGNDALAGGGDGQARMFGGKGNDVFTVKAGKDLVIETANEGADLVNAHVDYQLTDHVESLRLMVGGLTGRGNELANRVIGSTGGDTIYLAGGNDNSQGGAGDDRIWGGDGVDNIRGEIGRDQLHGDAGNDLLDGGEGDDVLHGGDGVDQLQGGVGVDRLTGGSGSDTFLYRAADLAGSTGASADVITDFSSGQRDKINLGAIDARSATGGDDRFVFIGGAEFHRKAGELRYETDGRDGVLTGDVNGDGRADFAIHLLGVTSLSSGDLVL